MISADWEMRSVLALQDAGVLLVEDGNHGEYRPRPDEFVPEGVPFIRAADLADGEIDLAGAERINAVARARIRKGVGAPGDIILSHKGTVGKLARAPFDAPDYVCSPQTTFWRVIDDTRVDPRFLYFFMSGSHFRAQLKRRMDETDMAPYVSLTAQRELLVPIPPLAEQRAIAAVLGALDDKIEANRRMNATLEALARALFKSWFVDFDPVRAKMEGRALAPDLAALFPARLTDSPLGPIPEGWEASRLDSVAANVSDVAKAEELEGNEHYIGLEHMPRQSISLAEWDDASGLESHKARFRMGDTLFGKLRPYFHKVGRALVDGVCSTDIVVVRAKRPLHAAYALMHASSVDFVAFNDQSSTGTKMPRTSWGRMAEYPLVAPSDPVAAAFEEIVSPMLNRIGANVFQSRTLAQLRDLLLPKLLSGALRVRDVEGLPNEAGT